MGTRQKVALIAAILVTVLFVAALVLLVPRPDIVIETVSYSAPGCVAPATTQTVTADFILLNRGTADGTVDVTFLVDGRTVVYQTYSVFARGTTPGRLEASLNDCATHAYDLTVRYYNPPGG